MASREARLTTPYTVGVIFNILKHIDIMKTKTIINTGFCIFSILLSTLSWSQNETPKADFRNVNWHLFSSTKSKR